MNNLMSEREYREQEILHEFTGSLWLSPACYTPQHKQRLVLAFFPLHMHAALCRDDRLMRYFPALRRARELCYLPHRCRTAVSQYVFTQLLGTAGPQLRIGCYQPVLASLLDTLAQVEVQQRMAVINVFARRIYKIMREDTEGKIPQDVLERINMSMASLEQALLDKDPMMPQHLRNIHTTLLNYPESVHLLEDADIAKLIGAAQVHTNTQIVTQAARSKSVNRKKIDVSDL